MPLPNKGGSVPVRWPRAHSSSFDHNCAIHHDTLACCVDGEPQVQFYDLQSPTQSLNGQQMLYR